MNYFSTLHMICILQKPAIIDFIPLINIDIKPLVANPKKIKRRTFLYNLPRSRDKPGPHTWRKNEIKRADPYFQKGCSLWKGGPFQNKADPYTLSDDHENNELAPSPQLVDCHRHFVFDFERPGLS